MKRVIVPPALAELHDAAAFHAERANVEPGLAFVAEVERVVNALLANLSLGAVFRGNGRSIAFAGFPMASSIRLEDELERQLHKLAEETGRSKAHVVREAIQKYLEDRSDYLLVLKRLEQTGLRVNLEDIKRELGLAH